MGPLPEDLRDAWRSVRARPATSLGIVLILALGIGPTTSVSAIVDAVLFRRLGVADPETLAKVYTASRKGAEEYWTTSYPVYRDYAEQTRAFRRLALYRENLIVDLADPGRRQMAEQVRAAVITGNGFGVLGVRAARGRMLQPEDDRPGAPPAAVIGHALWRRRFGGTDDAVGREIDVNGTAFRIVGVAPKGFRGLDLASPTELWAPFAHAVEVYPGFRGQILFRSTASFGIVGRLAPGVTRQQAQTELETIAERLGAGRPPTYFESGEPVPEPWPRVVPAAFSRSRSLQRVARTVGAVAVLVLLAACLNAAGLLLARAERRRRDTAVRLALGAPRARLLRVLLLEILLYGVVGAAAGGLFAVWSAAWLLHLAPPELPLPALHTSASAGVGLVLTAAAALAACALVALAPARRLFRRDSALGVWGDLPALSGGRRRGLARNAFVAAQVAASLILIAGAGLYVRSLLRLEAIDSGVDADHVVVAAVSPARAAYTDAEGERLLSRVLARVRELPDTRAAALALSMPPFTASTSIGRRGEERPAGLGVVSPGYFDALGIPLLRGRAFEAADGRGAPTVAVVNRVFAERWWPGQDPIGQTLDGIGPQDRRAEVVGLVANVHNVDLLEPPSPAVYVPLDQFFGSWSWQSGAAVIVAARSAPRTAAHAVRAAIASIEPRLFVEPMPLRDELAEGFARVRFLALLLSIFGVLVVAIAATGLAALLAHEMSARRRELAVRAALGARPAALGRLVFARGLGLVAGGLALGFPGALALGKALAAADFGVPAADPLVLCGAAAVLAAVGLTASLGPALRAARVRIAEVLRAD